MLQRRLLVKVESLGVNTAMLLDQLCDGAGVEDTLSKLSELLDVLLEHVEDVHRGGRRLRYIELHRRNRVGDPILFDHLIVLAKHIFVPKNLLQWPQRLLNSFVDEILEGQKVLL